MAESGEPTFRYQTPPPELAAIAEVPGLPAFQPGPGGAHVLVLQPEGLVPLADLARPSHRLAGLRFDPRTLATERRVRYTGLSFVDTSNGARRDVEGIPAGARASWVSWAPDGSAVAFVAEQDNRLTLWAAAVNDARARCVADRRLNAVAGQPYRWLPDSRGFLCCLAPDRAAPSRPDSGVPGSPIVEEHGGGCPAPARTNPDLLRDAADDALFEHYLTSELAGISRDGSVTRLGLSGGIIAAVPSPDARFLLVQTIHRPYSHQVPYTRFPSRVEILDAQGQLVAGVADMPLAEAAALGADAVRPGPRAFEWRPDRPATLAWIEALDGGVPAAQAAQRDRILMWDAPFRAPPEELARFEFRCDRVLWGDDRVTLAREAWHKTRMVRIWRLAPGTPGTPPSLLRSYRQQDRYGDPGSPVMVDSERGGRVLARERATKALLFAGAGAGPDGDRPFVDAIDPETGHARRLWRSRSTCYEAPRAVMDGRRLFFTRETAADPPDLFIGSLGRGTERRLTTTANPFPALAHARKELIRYRRADGVNLTATLYLPPGKTEADGPFPTLLWAYPNEFKDADSAGQIKDSPHRFSRLDWQSPLAWLLRGYAVLDRPDMPIIGTGDTEPNDTYVEQLVASAEAAVDELVRRGVSDRTRIAVGGHSYGGFMAANLLAHTRLFRAGIARSGAYNRTLTPFTFQNEERTLWQARDVYLRMSPFLQADRIRDPLLLIHGVSDENEGTFPMQSERLYQALKGLGSPARLVLLPLEGHGYRARESVLHVLWETDRWLSRHLSEQAAPPRTGQSPMQASASRPRAGSI